MGFIHLYLEISQPQDRAVLGTVQHSDSFWLESLISMDKIE